LYPDLSGLLPADCEGLSGGVAARLAGTRGGILERSDR